MEENLSYHDFQRFRAHYALQDPERELEKRIDYNEAKDEIRHERMERAIEAVLANTGITVQSWPELMEHADSIPDDLRSALIRDDWFKTYFTDPSL